MSYRGAYGIYPANDINSIATFKGERHKNN
jgi:hypothetical protein